MSYFLLLLILPFGFAYLLYRGDRGCLALTTLQREFKANFSINKPPKFQDEMVYFLSDDEKSHYVNGLRVCSSHEGLFCKGGVIYPWIRPFFIPWAVLKKTGEKRCYFFIKKDIYTVKGFNVSIAVSKKHGVK